MVITESGASKERDTLKTLKIKGELHDPPFLFSILSSRSIVSIISLL